MFRWGLPMFEWECIAAQAHGVLYRRIMSEVLTIILGGGRGTRLYPLTADAVRKNLDHFRVQKPSRCIILSGDQLYRMDLEDFMREHIESGAPVSIAAAPVNRLNDGDYDGCAVREGLIIILEGAVIRDGTVIQ